MVDGCDGATPLYPITWMPLVEQSRKQMSAALRQRQAEGDPARPAHHQCFLHRSPEQQRLRLLIRTCQQTSIQL